MIESVIKGIYELLRNEEYDEIARITNGERLSSEEIKESIAVYGCKLVAYPDQIDVNSIEVENSNPKEWSVVAPVYTEEEGLSDLSIELTITKKGESHFKIELDNIHVH